MPKQPAPKPQPTKETPQQPATFRFKDWAAI